MTRIIQLSLIVVLVLAGVGWLLMPTRPYRYAEVQPGELYTAGMRSGEEFNRALDLSQAKTALLFVDAIDVRQPAYAEAQNDVYKRKLRLRQSVTPAGDWPSEDQIRVALEELQTVKHYPILIASLEGVRRPGMLIAAYLTSVKKLDKAAAAARLKSLYGDAPGLADVLRFLDVYDPALQRMSSSLPLSRE